MKNFSILLVHKEGKITVQNLKEYNEEDLYKKCGFTKPTDFKKQTEWTQKINGIKYAVAVYGKTVGKANYENKYEFPPPIDKHLFFGKCVIIARKILLNGEKEYVSLDIALWNSIYDKLMGGFEDLSKTAKEDEEEIDELDNIPEHQKTKTGYLKDGFVIEDDHESADSSDSDEIEEEEEEENENNSDDNESEELEIHHKPLKKKARPANTIVNPREKEECIVDISLELEEEEFSD